jgi:predicted GIY-YIG superfamily endonuclease
MSEENKSFVYILKAGSKAKSPIKVGVASNIQKRIKQLQTGNPHEIVLVMHFVCDSRNHAFRLEKTIHDMLKGQRLFGEWFSVSRNNLMKVLNKMGNQDEIDSIVKNMGLFDRHGNDVTRDTVKLHSLKKTIISRDIEIADVQRALVDAKKIRGAYVERLIQLGVTYQEIKELKKGAKA